MRLLTSRLLVAGLFLLPLADVWAQGGVLLQGVTNVEFWQTDSASRLTARGGGRPSALGRADVWAAIEPVRNIVLFGELLGEMGSARDLPGNLLTLKQGGLRYSPSDAFTLQAGKVPQVLGTFSTRSLSFRNPLIAIPDGYSLTYPAGVRVDGTVGIVDYRAGVLSLALSRTGYTPDPGSAARPSAGVGITPFTGFRVGMSATKGPYLNPDFSASLLRSQDWKVYNQRIFAGDIQLSRGYFEGNAEIARSSYDVPGRAEAIYGLVYYLEGKYTFTPRFFGAVRLEQNDYPFIFPANETFWIANGSTFNDAEVGGGFRPSAHSTIKVSVRKDHWLPNASPQAPHDDGYAVAMQFSQWFDVVDILARRQRR